MRPKEKKKTLDLVELIKSGFIHPFRFFHQQYLFDSTTNSLFRSDFDFSDPQETKQLEKELQQLVSEGFFTPVQPQFHDSREFKSYCFMMTRKCNFSCSYCFEGNLNHSSHYLSAETAMKALRWISKVNPTRKKIEIDFFGGEPLLVYEEVKKIVEQSKQLAKETGKEYLFSLTTNASLFTPEQLDFLDKQNISLIISLDGNESYHNHFRKYHNQKGTFEDVWLSVQLLLKKRKQGYYVRGTYTHQTLAFAEQVIWLYEQGIKKISYEPVVSNDAEVGIQEEDLPTLQKEYGKLAEWYVHKKKDDPDLSFYHFELDLQNGVCIDKLMTSCGAGVEYLSLSPEGNVYPCHQFDNQPEFCIGNIHDETMNDSLLEQFRNITQLTNKSSCKDCWARYLCGGGCIANNIRLHQCMEKSNPVLCDIQKMRLEAALAVQGQLMEVQAV